MTDNRDDAARAQMQSGAATALLRVCPECGAGTGERCTNRLSGTAYGKPIEHVKRMRETT